MSTNPSQLGQLECPFLDILHFTVATTVSIVVLLRHKGRPKTLLLSEILAWQHTSGDGNAVAPLTASTLSGSPSDK